MIGSWNILFQASDAKSKTVVYSEHYLSDNYLQKEEEKVTLANIDREVIQNVMNDNESFRLYMYKKALLDIVTIDPELMNTIDGSYFDEKDFHAFHKTQIIQHSQEEIVDNDKDIW